MKCTPLLQTLPRGQRQEPVHERKSHCWELYQVLAGLGSCSWTTVRKGVLGCFSLSQKGWDRQKLHPGSLLGHPHSLVLFACVCRNFQAELLWIITKLTLKSGCELLKEAFPSVPEGCVLSSDTDKSLPGPSGTWRGKAVEEGRLFAAKSLIIKMMLQWEAALLQGMGPSSSLCAAFLSK